MIAVARIRTMQAMLVGRTMLLIGVLRMALGSRHLFVGRADELDRFE